MKIILFEDSKIRAQLKPLTLTRPIGALRIGIQTIQEKWAHRFNATVSFQTEEYLQAKYLKNDSIGSLYINASYLPTLGLIELIENLEANQSIKFRDDLVAYFQEGNETEVIKLNIEDRRQICRLPDLFLMNGAEIESDFIALTKGRKSAKITDPFTRVYNEKNIFLEEGADLKDCTLNAENGPIYIGKNAVLQESCVLIGPVAVGEKSKVAFGARLRPNTTLGPECRVGGEVGNSIFFGHSNKAHDGFLGNSYIGEWCNLGANTNNSNLKNDYTEVKLYNYGQRALVKSGEIFCGTFMGDYSKAGISTMFNTGTVVGVCCNVFGAGFQEKFIASFSWGGKAEGYTKYRFEKALEVIDATIARRDKQLIEVDTDILKHILEGRDKE